MDQRPLTNVLIAFEVWMCMLDGIFEHVHRYRIIMTFYIYVYVSTDAFISFLYIIILYPY